MGIKLLIWCDECGEEYERKAGQRRAAIESYFPNHLGWVRDFPASNLRAGLWDLCPDCAPASGEVAKGGEGA